MRIHQHLPRLASCLSWPIAKSGFNTLPDPTILKRKIRGEHWRRSVRKMVFFSFGRAPFRLEVSGTNF